MKRELDLPPRGLKFLYRILLILVWVLVIGILGVTFWVFRRPPVKTGNSNVPANSTQGVSSERFFTGIGRIRSSTADTTGATVILSIVFPYDSDDRPFSEELASHIKDFRTLTLNYISRHTVKELRSLGDGGVKKELLDQFNGILRLGKIKLLYFNDYLIVE
jgi:flagellar basal body-associated protein FliL